MSDGSVCGDLVLLVDVELLLVGLDGQLMLRTEVVPDGAEMSLDLLVAALAHQVRRLRLKGLELVEVFVRITVRLLHVRSEILFTVELHFLINSQVIDL